MIYPLTCQTVEISNQEKVLGQCGRSLKKGVCPVHGHYTNAPSRWMVENIVRNEPKLMSDRKKNLMFISKWMVIIGLLGLLFHPAFLILSAIGVQMFITVLCWMK